MDMTNVAAYDACRVNQEIPYTVEGKVDYARLNEFFTPNEVVFETPAFKLRFFGGDKTKDAILILPPQAGHTSSIADYDKNQSLVECARDNCSNPVYCIEWLSCTRERSAESYGDLVQQVVSCINFTDTKKAYLQGLCQGGTLATVTTALYPELVAGLSVAGAPIDVTEKSILSEAIKKPMALYEVTVGLSYGLMHGSIMLECWKSNNVQKLIIDKILKGEPTTYRELRFDSWYFKHVSDLAGEGWYLWLVERLFKGNLLIKNEMVVDGRVVNLKNITCPVNLIVGLRDDISPPSHTLSLLDKMGTTDVSVYSGDAGHISVFMSRKMVKDCWAQVFANLN